FRKHWFVLLLDSFGTLIAGFVPFVLFPVAASFNAVPQALLAPTLVTFAATWWFLVIWCALAVIWTDYYLDIWIVTDRRIVNINQISLFDREVTSWRLDRIQEVTIGVRNIFETLLGYGSLEVQTAGPADEFATIRGVRDPGFIQKTITELVDRFDPAPQSR